MLASRLEKTMQSFAAPEMPATPGWVGSHGVTPLRIKGNDRFSRRDPPRCRKRRAPADVTRRNQAKGERLHSPESHSTCRPARIRTLRADPTHQLVAVTLVRHDGYRIILAAPRFAQPGHDDRSVGRRGIGARTPSLLPGSTRCRLARHDAMFFTGDVFLEIHRNPFHPAMLEPDWSSTAENGDSSQSHIPKRLLGRISGWMRRPVQIANHGSSDDSSSLVAYSWVACFSVALLRLTTRRWLTDHASNSGGG